MDMDMGFSMGMGVRWTFESAIEVATDVVVAEFVTSRSLQGATEYEFIVHDRVFGNTADTIFVYVVYAEMSRRFADPEFQFSVGSQYLLALIKLADVYSHLHEDGFIFTTDLILDLNDPSRSTIYNEPLSLHSRMNFNSRSITSGEIISYASTLPHTPFLTARRVFITSDYLVDIISGSPHVLVVEINEPRRMANQGIQSGLRSTDIYFTTVVEVLKGDMQVGDRVEIVFFAGTVFSGETHIVSVTPVSTASQNPYFQQFTSRHSLHSPDQLDEIISIITGTTPYQLTGQEVSIVVQGAENFTIHDSAGNQVIRDGRHLFREAPNGELQLIGSRTTANPVTRSVRYILALDEYRLSNMAFSGPSSIVVSTFDGWRYTSFVRYANLQAGSMQLLVSPAVSHLTNANTGAIIQPTYKSSPVQLDLWNRAIPTALTLYPTLGLANEDGIHEQALLEYGIQALDDNHFSLSINEILPMTAIWDSDADGNLIYVESSFDEAAVSMEIGFEPFSTRDITHFFECTHFLNAVTTALGYPNRGWLTNQCVWNLRELDARNMNITTLHGICQLTSLQSIDLRHNRLSSAELTGANGQGVGVRNIDLRYNFMSNPNTDIHLSFMQNPAVFNIQFWPQRPWEPPTHQWVGHVVNNYLMPRSLWQDITFCAHRFVGVASWSSNNRQAMYSEGIVPGVSWSVRPTPGVNPRWRSVTSDRFGKYLAVADWGAAGSQVMNSWDGEIWALQSTPFANQSWSSVAYGGGVGFVAVSSWGAEGRQVMTSYNNGFDWELRHTPGENQRWTSITHSRSLNLFVAVSSRGPNGTQVMTSPDAINWTLRNTPGPNQEWSSVVYGNGMFVAVSQSSGPNQVMTSRDGINWTLQRTPGNHTWNDIAFGGGLFVAVGDNGASMTSPCGVNWTMQETPWMFVNWNSVAYGNGRFIAIPRNQNSAHIMMFLV